MVFRSRTEALKFRTYLFSYGIDAKVVNTPRELSVSCGLSLRISGDAKDKVLALAKGRNADIYAVRFGGYTKIG